MKKLITILLIGCSITSNAQFLKRLKSKISEKINNVVDQKIDKTIDDVIYGKREQNTSTPSNTVINTNTDKSIGSCKIEHNNSFGEVTITEFGKVKSQLGYQYLRINGSWVTVGFDVSDGLYITIKDSNAPMDDITYFSGKTYVLFDSEEEIKGDGASISIAYNPEQNNNPKAPYQNYIVKNGKVTINNIDENQLILSLSGTPKDRYGRSKNLASMVKVNIDVTNTAVEYLDNAPKEKVVDKGYVPDLEQYGIKTTPSVNKIYTFNTQIQYEINDGKEKQHYNIWQSNNGYSATNISTDQGNMICIIDGDSSLSLMENDGQKLQLSMNYNQNSDYSQMLSESMNHESITKTGKTKSILGYNCYEYTTNYEGNQSTLWVTKNLTSINSPFSNEDGTLLEANFNQKNETFTMKAIKIEKFNKTVNTGEYKNLMNMF